jgi:hypothetical protein
MRRSQKIFAAIATMTMLLSTGLVSGNNFFNLNKLFKIETDAPKLEQMNMPGMDGNATASMVLQDTVLNALIDLNINWPASTTE